MTQSLFKDRLGQNSLWQACTHLYSTVLSSLTSVMVLVVRLSVMVVLVFRLPMVVVLVVRFAVVMVFVLRLAVVMMDVDRLSAVVVDVRHLPVVFVDVLDRAPANRVQPESYYRLAIRCTGSTVRGNKLIKRFEKFSNNSDNRSRLFFGADA